MLRSSQKQPRSTARRWVTRILCYAGPIGVVALLLTLQHRPGWYSPARLTDVEARDARADATRMADQMGIQLVAGVPFEVVLREKNVNAWLTAVPRAWQELFSSSEVDIADPAVAFIDGRVRIGALFRSGPWPLILSTTWTLAVSSDRESIDVYLVGVQGGSLPVPTGVIAGVAGALQGSAWSDAAGVAPAVTQTNSQEAIPISAFIDGMPMPNRFVWPNGERAFRISAIEVGKGRARIGIEPL